jgi:mannose-6-phosphate isomerase-like protein (cupin superfamily)
MKSITYFLVSIARNSAFLRKDSNGLIVESNRQEVYRLVTCNIEGLLEAAAMKSSRKAIFKKGLLDTGLLLYPPGQSTPDHKHADIDEVFYVVSGEGTVRINNEELPLKEKDMLYSPHGEMHGFYNTSPHNWVVLQVKVKVN